jgi:hypothetical protein
MKEERKDYRPRRSFERSPDQALAEVQELRNEVASDLFIPKKFRRSPFTTETRDRYVAYLDREISRIQEKTQRRVFENGAASPAQKEAHESQNHNHNSENRPKIIPVVR